MITIHKFELALIDDQRIEMPQGAIILSCQIQRGNICLWAEVNTDLNKTSRRFLIYGTGNPILQKANRVFIATVQQGQFVWHVFESFVL